MKLICPACLARSSEILGDRDGYDVFRCDVAACRQTWRTPVLGHVRMAADVPREGEKYAGNWYQNTMCESQDRPTFAARFEHDLAVGVQRIEKLRELVNPNDALVKGFRFRLLDVGCGNGAFVLAALRAGFDVQGHDLGSATISWARQQHPEIRFRLRAFDHPDTISGSGWHVVTCHDVLEHLADPFRMLLDIHRAMAPNGVLVIEAPDPCSPEMVEAGLAGKHVKPREHTMLLSVKTWSEMLRGAGFAVLRSDRPVAQKLAIYAARVRST